MRRRVHPRGGALLIAGLVAVAAACGARPADDGASAAAPAPPEPAPEWVTTGWEQLIGTWIADNRAFRSDTDTWEAYGVDWTWGIGRRSLAGRLYGIRDGQEAATFWEFREFWHPGEGRLITTQFGRDGTYGVGPHERRADGSMEMLQTFFNPRAGTVTRVGHRSWLDGDTHTTTSFDVDARGAWQERRTYIWIRQ